MTAFVDQLRQLIHDRDYRPGERLPSERELAERFGISRPSVRRAVASLVEHGVLESRDRSGLYVRGTNADDLLAVRLVLEPWGAALAARGVRSEEVDELQTLLEAAAEAIDTAPEFARLDRRVHEVIIGAARNEVLRDLYLSLQQRISAARAASSASRATRVATLDVLTALVAAIAAGDADGASVLMTEHLTSLLDTHATAEATL